jgi:hypothetical protein
VLRLPALYLWEGRNSALAENYFKPKMISVPTLPGVFDVDLEPFIDESEG